MGNKKLIECDICKEKLSFANFSKCYQYEYEKNKKGIDDGWMKNNPIIKSCNKCWDGRKFTDCKSYWIKEECNHLHFSEACLDCTRNIPQQCPGYDCECEGKDATIKHQNTAYVQQCFNYILLCDFCMKQNEEYWKERWDEYYSQVL